MQKKCIECKKMKNMSEWGAKIGLCQSCRTCKECQEVIKVDKLYYIKETPYVWESRSGEYVCTYCQACWDNNKKRKEGGAYVDHSYNLDDLIANYSDRVQKKCRKCQGIWEMNELEVKLRLCRNCRTCKTCNDVVDDGTIYYALDENYREERIFCHFHLGKGWKDRISSRYDLDRLLSEYEQEQRSQIQVPPKK